MCPLRASSCGRNDKAREFGRDEFKTGGTRTEINKTWLNTSKEHALEVVTLVKIEKDKGRISKEKKDKRR